MKKEYRIQEVKVPVHGLYSNGFLESVGYELFLRDNIKLVSLGVYDSEEKAKEAAKRNAEPLEVKFV